ncbi:hypothetical protein [Sphingomonas sp.]
MQRLPAAPGWPGEYRRQRQFKQRALGTCAIGLASAGAEIGSTLLRIVEARAHRTVDRVPAFGEQRPCRWTDAITSGTEDARCLAERGDDRGAQRVELCRFQFGGQIARKAVVRIDVLVMRRRYPWMEMRADCRNAVLQDPVQRIDRQRRGRNGVVDQIDDGDAAIGETLMRAGQRRHCGDAAIVARQRRAPVKLLFGINENAEARAKALGPYEAIGRSNSGWSVRPSGVHRGAIARQCSTFGCQPLVAADQR